MVAGPANALVFATQLLAQGKLAEAKSIARGVPRSAGSEHLLGMIALGEGKPRQAVEHLARARTMGGQGPGLRLALGRAYKAAGRARDATAAFEEALTLSPNFAEAHYELGLLAAESDPAAAHAQFARAAGLRPDHAEAWNNLGAAARRLGRHAEAIAAFEKAVAARPDYGRALINLAIALTEAGEAMRALDPARKAAALAPDDPAAAHALALALEASGRLEEAETLLEALVRPAEQARLALRRGEPARAVRLLEGVVAETPSAPLFQSLGEAFAAAGQREDAAKAFRQALVMDPTDEAGASLGLALLGEAVPDAAPPEFVRRLFDDYAPRFDRELVGNLNYSGPAILRGLYDRLGAEPTAILDLGCGTGLGGAAFKDIATQLDGVDLSERMVEAARARGIYDGLAAEEILAYLTGVEAGRYGLVLAADVFVYLGDLAPVLAQSARVLAPGGRVLFTVERAEGEGYELGQSRRYAHAPPYLRRVAQAVGLEVLVEEPVSTRSDRGAPVPGMAYAFGKPAR